MSLRDILQDLFDEMSDDLADDLGIFKTMMTIDQVIYCTMDEQDEVTELATTKFPFIVQAIVEGGKPTNRYVVTWEVVE